MKAKKILALLTSVVMMLGTMIIPAQAAKVITVGDSADYATMTEAIANADAGDTVKLTSNITENMVKVTTGKDIDIDFAGNTLTGSMFVEKGATADISGGYITQTDTVAGIEVQGVVTLTDMNIESARHAIRVDGLNTAGTSLVVNSGTYESKTPTGWTAHTINAGEGSTVVIKDGTFIGAGRANAGGSGNCVMVKDHTTNVTIEGGTFVDANGGEGSVCPASLLTISGGTFDRWNYDNYLAEGKAAAKNADGMYEVKDAVAKIGNKNYGSIADAVADASTGTIIEVVAAEIEIPTKLKDGIIFKTTVGTKVTNSIYHHPDSGATGNAITYDGFEFTQQVRYIARDMKFLNCSFTGSTGIYSGSASGVWTIDNCEFYPTWAYGLQDGDGNGVINVTNSVVTGWTSFGNNVTVNFDNCTFKKGECTYSVIQVYGKVTISNSTFEEDWDDVTGDKIFGTVDADAAIEITNTDFKPGNVFDYLDDNNGIISIDATKDENGKYTGGTFSNPVPADMLAEGVTLTQNGNTFSVKNETAVAVTVANKARSVSFDSTIIINQYFTVEGVDLAYAKANGGFMYWNAKGATNVAADNFANATKTAIRHDGTDFYGQILVPPAKYAEEYYICMYVELADGTVVYSPVTDAYSVKAYCEGRIANSSNALMKALAQALLDYGKAAAEYFSKN